MGFLLLPQQYGELVFFLSFYFNIDFNRPIENLQKLMSTNGTMFELKLK